MIKNLKVHFMGPVGSIEGPRLVFKLWRSALVSLESLGMFCYLECKALASKGNFLQQANRPSSLYGFLYSHFMRVQYTDCNATAD